jgi:hypothetical protein
VVATAEPAEDAVMDRTALLDRYAGGYDAVVAALDGATDAELDARPADGGWTARECVHHLADSEARSMLRLRQLLADDDPVIEPYDQDAWAARLPYDGPVDEPLAVVRAVRAMSLATLRQAGDDVWDRAGRHPEHDEPYSVTTWLELYASHPYEHADQISAARRQETGSGLVDS